MKTIIVPLTKSAWMKGRIGKMEKQDWFLGLKKALILRDTITDSEVIIVSNVKIPYQPSEIEMYRMAAKKLGAEKIRMVSECFDTISQIDWSFQTAKKENGRLIFISTWTHWLRVQWILLRLKQRVVKHLICWGRPRPRELLTDLILTFLFPMIDMLGMRKKFLDTVKKRRLAGKF